MKLSVIGTGYVGLVAAAAFADYGHDVLCADQDAQKIASLQEGKIPIFEPQLEAVVRKNVCAGRLRFCTDNREATRYAEAIFLAVGTPTGHEDGAPDLHNLFSVASDIGGSLSTYTVVINKSTVPVGTAEQVAKRMREAGASAELFDVVSNPEFLKEGSALDDFVHPDRVVVGADNPRARAVMARIYKPFDLDDHQILTMDVRSAELTKYACNAYLAMRISYINDMARLCESVGANVGAVRRGMGSDPRIGNSFLYPGCGYGGSCFPKDTRALLQTGRSHGLELQLVAAAADVNERQKEWLAQKVRDRLGPNLDGKVVGLWGLAFKPNTDDVREAPALAIADFLAQRGARLRVHDPVAAANFSREAQRLDWKIEFCDKADDVLEGADALVLCTEWAQYRSPDFTSLVARMRTANIFDGRNQWKRAEVEAAGAWYTGIGT